jgi:hypothetical protein
MAVQPQLAAVTRDGHASKRWQRPSGYSFASAEAVVPLAAVELASAVHSMPLAFAKEADRFLLVAVLALTPGTNLYVGPNGQWLGAYVPATLRGYPFRMVRTEGSDQLVLAVDESSGLIVDDGASGEPFFEAEGNPSPSVTAIVNFLSQTEASRKQTDHSVAALAEAGVIEPWPIKINAGEGEHDVQGLHRVDEAALNALSDEAFGKLRRAGALSIAYGQLFSMTNINMFPQLARMQAQLAPKPVTPETVLKSFDSVDPFFGLSAHDNLIKF